MSRDLDKPRSERHALRSVDEDNMDHPAPWEKPDGWGSFITVRYSSAEIYSENGNIHVKMRETRFQDGRLTSEECEGTLDRRAYERVVQEAQGYFLNQVGNFLKLLYAPFLLPTHRRHDESRRTAMNSNE